MKKSSHLWLTSNTFLDSQNEIKLTYLHILHTAYPFSVCVLHIYINPQFYLSVPPMVCQRPLLSKFPFLKRGPIQHKFLSG